MRKVLIAAIMLMGIACSDREGADFTEEQYGIDIACSDREGTDFTEEQYGIDMVYVKCGTFIMGCTPEQESFYCFNTEKPAHQVALNDFYIGRYEVTQKQWREIMGTDIHQQHDKAVPKKNGVDGEGDDYPMYYVSWDDVQEFIKRLNEKTGRKYRLPTEAEWEYAARGGNQSRGYIFSGSDDPQDVAWFSDNSVYKRVLVGSNIENELDIYGMGGNVFERASIKILASPYFIVYRKPHPVGTKQANELGVYDMSGNIGEWVSDWHGDYSGDPQRNPMGPRSGSERVVRGGCYSNGHAYFIRVSFRELSLFPQERDKCTGFRLALSSE